MAPVSEWGQPAVEEAADTKKRRWRLRNRTAKTGTKRGWGPFTGGQLTMIILGITVAVGTPGAAYAASAFAVGVTDPVTGVQANVSTDGRLQVTDALPGTPFRQQAYVSNIYNTPYWLLGNSGTTTLRVSTVMIANGGNSRVVFQLLAGTRCGTDASHTYTSSWQDLGDYVASSNTGVTYPFSPAATLTINQTCNGGGVYMGASLLVSEITDPAGTASVTILGTVNSGPNT